MDSTQISQALDACSLRVKNTFLEIDQDPQDKSIASKERRSASAPPRLNLVFLARDVGCEQETSFFDEKDFGETDASDQTDIGESFNSFDTATRTSSFSGSSTGCSFSFANGVEQGGPLEQESVQSVQPTDPSRMGHSAMPLVDCSDKQWPAERGEEEKEEEEEQSVIGERKARIENAPIRSKAWWQRMLPTTAKRSRARQKSGSLITLAHQEKQRQQRQRQFEKGHQTTIPSMLEFASYPHLSSAAAPEGELAFMAAIVQDRLSAQTFEAQHHSAHKNRHSPMYCKSCGGAMSSKSKFCTFCGASMASVLVN